MKMSHEPNVVIALHFLLIMMIFSQEASQSFSFIDFIPGFLRFISFHTGQ